MDKWIQLQSSDGVDNLFPVGKMDLLWTNATPTSQFSGQTINIDLTDYEFVYIVYKLFYSSTTNSSVNEFARKGRNTCTYIGSAGYIWFREAEVTDNGIIFSNGTIYATYGNGAETANSERLVPLYIYGIKMNTHDLT